MQSNYEPFTCMKIVKKLEPNLENRNTVYLEIYIFLIYIYHVLRSANFIL